MFLIDTENYFEIVEAIHTYLVLHHEGMHSEKYALICKLNYKPSMAWRESDTEKNNPYYYEVLNLTDKQLNECIDKIHQILESEVL